MAKPPPVDRRKVFVRIADDLRQDIAAGRYAVGGPFPSIAELVDRFAAAKATVERALELLRDEGLLASRQGSRTVVIAEPPPSIHPTAEPDTYREELRVLHGRMQDLERIVALLSTQVEELDRRTQHL
jgi:DNA-binding GntR family transcriptional regulator